jgi:hypothetical protein
MGGAIFNMQGTVTIRDSTVAGNTAVGGADNVSDHGKGIGGAVFNLSGTFTALGSTFANNTASYYAAQIYNLVYDGHQARTAQTTLRDTIVANGIGPADLASVKTAYITPADLGSANADVSQFDLVRTVAPPSVLEAGTVTGSPLTSDPLLGPLQNNGGLTETMAPAAGSPVIDAGDPGCLDLGGMRLLTDQRGALRPAGARCDIGAFEVATPGAITGHASAVAMTSATLNGAATNPDLAGASAFFQYGPTTSYGTSTTPAVLGPTISKLPFSTGISGLAPGVLYHFRAVVTNALGTSFGADQTLMTLAPPGGGGGGTGGAITAAVSSERLSPVTFRAAPSGPSAVTAKLRYGTKVTFTLNEPASVRFTAIKLLPGRITRGARCLKPGTANARGRRCTRRVLLPDSFARTGAAGANRFRFTGRLRGHKLNPGSYLLIATPSAGGHTGKSASASFQIIR